MTKIKNTKKGMAKKTLSISLAVAMLATSNVPVWAAEFTDGTDAAFTSEAVVETPVEEVVTDAPVVEEEVAPEAESTDVKMTLSDWKSNDLSFSGSLEDADGNKVTKFNYEFRIDGKEIVDHGNTSYSGTAISLTELNNRNLNLKPEDAGHQLSINISADNGFTTVIGPVEIKSVDISEGTMDLGNASLTYTGKQVSFTDNQIKEFTFAGDATDLTYGDFKYSYEGKDLVNADNGKDHITLIATVDKTGYTGAIKTTGIRIAKRAIDAEELELTLNKNVVAYAERNSISSEMVTVKNTETGDVYPISTYTVTSSQLTNAGDEKALTVTFNDASLATDKAFNRNYFTNSAVTKNTKETVKLTANNMSDFRIVVDSLRRSNFDENKAKKAIHFYLGDKEVTSALQGAITYAVAKPADNATSVDVVITGDNKNVIGNTTATIKLTLNEIVESELNLKIDDVAWPGHALDTFVELADVTYTGKEITRKVTNVQLGLGDKSVELKPEVDYKIEYVNDHTNAGTVSKERVYMYIVGIGDYSGRVKLGVFDINPAEIKDADITVPKTVQYDGSLVTPDEYMDGKVTVKATTKIDGKDAQIDVPTDAYTLTYTADKLAVGGKITTILTNNEISNKNFKVSDNGVIKAFATTISNKNLADENVKVEVVGGPYTYTGKAVIPTLKVTVDGVELAPDRDYEVRTDSNSVKAGDATVTVVGKGDYSGTKTVKYVINKANLADVKAEAKVATATEKAAFTYTGAQVKPTSANFKITLNGVELSKDDFAITYPTSSYNNVDAGEATVTLVPVKSNKNFNGEKLEVKFNILPKELTSAELAGKFYAFDENGNSIDFNSEYTFAYDGTEKTFKDVKFVPSKAEYNNMKLVEGKDYEIKYFNNITGPNAAIYVTGIGNYAGNSDTKFDGSEIAYTAKEEFKIEGVTVDQRNMTLKDTEYAGGLATTPNLTIKVGSKTLVEGTDYEFVTSGDTVNVTPTNKVLTATLKLKGGYKFNAAYANDWNGAFKWNRTDGTVTVTWKIVKKDVANTKITAQKTGETLKVTVYNENVIVPEKEYDVKENTDGTVTVSAKADSKNYTGSQKVTVENIQEIVGAPIIEKVNVVGNKATVVLSGEVEGAVGYDYVISTDKDCINNKNYDKVNKNVLNTNTTFTYTQQDMYYAYCHAWTRDENGKKVFSEWSNAYPFSVSAITPSQPVVTSVSVKGNTVTVKYTKSSNADGYDVVLGSKVATVAGEKRPVEYGTLVKKNIKGNTVTATFKNVKKGTYYAGLHAFNRTSEDGKKVFSPWSNVKKVTVK